MDQTMDLVTISVKEYQQLQDDSNMLNCLEACGVDNWHGYSEARKMYNEEYEED
jgi:hypothetical protein